MRPTAAAPFTLLIVASLLLSQVAPARAYTLQYTNASATQQIRWPTTTVNVALSTSLSNPPPFVLAARRALTRWSLASNILFNVTTSAAQTAGQDGVSLITVAPENASQFII